MRFLLSTFLALALLSTPVYAASLNTDTNEVFRSYGGTMPISIYDKDGSIKPYARWITKKCKVIFDSQVGKDYPESMIFDVGKAYGNLPVPTDEKYEFCGWHATKQDKDAITDESIIPDTKTLTLYAYWYCPDSKSFTCHCGS